MAEGAAVTVGYLFNAVTKSSALSRRFRSIMSRFGKVPYRYASLHDRLSILSRPHLSRLMEMRRDFLFHDEFGEVQHDRSHGQSKALHGMKADEWLFRIRLQE